MRLSAALLLLALAGCGREPGDGGGDGNLRNLAGAERNKASGTQDEPAPARAAAQPRQAAAGVADATSPPAPGSAQRAAILDALRPAVEAQLGTSVEFVVGRLEVERGWALVVADPRRRGGGDIDGRAIYGDGFDNMDGLTVSAILRFEGGRWTLSEHAIGATDVWYCDGHTEAPSSLTGC